MSRETLRNTIILHLSFNYLEIFDPLSQNPFLSNLSRGGTFIGATQSQVG